MAFNDSDVFKIIEGASYTLQIENDPELKRYLDDLIAKNGDEIAFGDILPAFRDAQDVWGGKITSVTLDGDTFLLYYREDLFKDPGERAAFKAKYGYELPDPPITWKQVVDLAQFFSFIEKQFQVKKYSGDFSVPADGLRARIHPSYSPGKIPPGFRDFFRGDTPGTETRPPAIGNDRGTTDISPHRFP